MRAKYESLSLAVLKDVAKNRGLKHLSALKKEQVIELMLAEDEKMSQGDGVSGSKSEEPKEAKKAKEAKEAAPRRRRAVAAPEAPEEKKAETESAPRRRRVVAAPEAAEEKQVEAVPEEKRVSVEDADKNADKQDADGAGSPLDSGLKGGGILEVLAEGYGFIRCENFLPGENDLYVSPAQIRRFKLRTGDVLEGGIKVKSPTEKYAALLYVTSVNGLDPEVAARRKKFEDLTPIFPDERLHLQTKDSPLAMRMVDLISPIGKGQRGMIVSPPKAGKTTLLKQTAKSLLTNNPEIHLIILLIDERPEEVTDMKEAIVGDNVEIIYSTFDELPEHHRRVSEMVIERARRLVEHKKDVVILLDSITRLARAYNLIVAPSGRTLSGGLDPAALHMPKRFFGAARNMREGGSLTVLATALVDTGSKMDDVVYEEFKGTGNMELVLDRKLSERRVFPALDIVKSGTRREDLLLTKEELEAVTIMRRQINGMKQEDAVENILNLFAHTRDNDEFVKKVIARKTK
ncbi:MAG: transcription termination factor Rho [Lachnospiraceae bacterium]|nr:transcription termination factor Rho [Lachnospiraceae bacterium]